ncbi:unnamed protein product [Lepeophtheirus salmonis]|uniref:DNA-directed RNA polymerase III subunit RPC9 n=1 Tax=Lepeophtheirus salmonis TaxID=72036 RepID=A0A7R8CIC2_LEPSM|nr:DNA-directed RNA polymerase III subunit rpc9-like [Lepeophtheirus salmonis]CAB4058352.1 unnamed protein product [Lepeophtheirus salmonis]CAF2830888.1 unnamed protein product [Lepeophtheirus salmonis]
MEVQKAVSRILTNEEVKIYLKSDENLKGPTATLRLEVLSYLDNFKSFDSLKEAHKALKSFGLTPSEELMIINHKPKSTVEILLLIEDCEDRFEEDKIEKLLQVIAEKL